jgi:hypothetical protein
MGHGGRWLKYPAAVARAAEAGELKRMGSVGAGMRKEWLLFADPTACGCKPNKLDIIYDDAPGI